MSVPEVGAFLSTTRISDPAEACRRPYGRWASESTNRQAAGVVLHAGRRRGAWRILRQHGLTAASLCVVFDGERYDDVESVRPDGGLPARGALEGRLAYTRRCIDTAAALGIPLVTFHMGMLPASPAVVAYQRVQGRWTRWRRMRASKG